MDGVAAGTHLLFPSGARAYGVPPGCFGGKAAGSSSPAHWEFFGAHRIGLALVDIGLLWLLILATLIVFWHVRALAGALFLPYVGWVAFATALNLAIWKL